MRKALVSVMLGALAGLVLAGIAAANPPCVVRVRDYNYNRVYAVYAPPANVAIGYQPDQSAIAIQLEIMNAKFDRLIRAVEFSNPSGQRLSVAIHPGVKVLQTRCASCHTEFKLRDNNGVILFNGDGNIATFDAKLQNRIMRAVYSGRMPQGSDMPDREVGEIMAYMDTLANQPEPERLQQPKKSSD